MSLKILMAEVSSNNCSELRVNQLKDAHSQRANQGSGAEFICLPLDHFKVQGPNGVHISFLYPILGPNLSLDLFRASAYPDNELKKSWSGSCEGCQISSQPRNMSWWSVEQV